MKLLPKIPYYSAMMLTIGIVSGCVTDADRLVSPGPSVAANKAARSPAGTSDSAGGGDWFVKSLPILRFTFPDDEEFIEGVRYSKMNLQVCDKDDLAHSKDLDDGYTISYFPGKHFEATKVLTHANFVICSFGVVEENQARSLQILALNAENGALDDSYALTKTTKQFGGAALVGNFLVSVTGQDQLMLFGDFMLNNSMKAHFFRQSKTDAVGKDAIYVPSGVQATPRVYFGHNITGTWRLLLPIAFKEGVIPLAALSQTLSQAYQENDAKVLDLLNEVAMPEGFPNGGVAPWSTVSQIWSTLERTANDSTLTNLRALFFKSYGLPLRADRTHDYLELKAIADKFQFDFSPTIGLDNVNRASYHKVGPRVKFVIPLLNPTWRVVADMIHEITHSVQNYSDHPSDEEIFRNEMQAHQKERVYLKGVSEKYEAVAISISAYNYIVAAAVPLLHFVTVDQNAEAPNLCQNVLLAYHLNRSKISKQMLFENNCGD